MIILFDSFINSDHIVLVLLKAHYLHTHEQKLNHNQSFLFIKINAQLIIINYLFIIITKKYNIIQIL